MTPRGRTRIILLFFLWIAAIAIVMHYDPQTHQWWGKTLGTIPVLEYIATILTLIVNIFVLTLGVTLICLLDRRVRWGLLRESVIIMLTQTVVVDTIKDLCGRLRPGLSGGATLFYGPIYDSPVSFSFPSGHASSAFALAAIFSAWYPRWRYVFMVLAAAVGFSRVQLDRHFLSDTLAGGVIGWYLATWLLWLLRRGRRPATTQSSETKTDTSGCS